MLGSQINADVNIGHGADFYNSATTYTLKINGREVSTGKEGVVRFTANTENAGGNAVELREKNNRGSVTFEVRDDKIYLELQCEGDVIINGVSFKKLVETVGEIESKVKMPPA
jgi:hypothetical protein